MNEPTMRAVAHRQPGDPFDHKAVEVIQVVRPDPLPTEVRVRVHAAGVSPVDWKTVAGGGMYKITGKPPAILGWDVSGVVDAVGYGVTRFSVGDEVFGLVWFPRAGGTFADYVTAPSRQLAAKPDGLSHVEAAGLPLAGLTAWQVLVETVDIQPGQRILVHAAAGGVGHLAVQIAKARGAHVLGTAGPAKIPFLRELGVDEPLDYTVAPFEDVVADLDVVIDGVGGEIGQRSIGSLREGGTLVSMPPPGGATRDAGALRGVRVVEMLVEPDHAGLEALAELFLAEQLRVTVDKTFPLEQVADALALGADGHTQGKIVLTAL